MDMIISKLMAAGKIKDTDNWITYKSLSQEKGLSGVPRVGYSKRSEKVS